MQNGTEPNIPTETVTNYQDADNGQIVPNSGPTGQSETLAEAADEAAADPGVEAQIRDIDIARGD